MLHNILQSIIVNNWYGGQMSALCAWSNGYTIEKKTDQNKIRRILKKFGYKAQFSCGILTIITTGGNS